MPIPILLLIKACAIVIVIAGGSFIWLVLFTDPDGWQDEEWQELVDDDYPW